MKNSAASSDAHARWSLRLLGGFELVALPGGERVALSGKRERVLLSYLALSPKGRQPRRKLLTLLWGDDADETTLDNLRTTVWRLRKALDDTEHNVLVSDGDDIMLDAAAFEIDAVAFRRLAAESQDSLEAAARLYAGEFLDGLDIDSEEFESWRRAEAAQYRQHLIDILTRLMALFDESGDTERTAEIGLRLLQLDPVYEAVVQRLMRLYGRSGRRGAAIQLYQSLSSRLREEFGSEPDAETTRIFAAVSRSDDVTKRPAGAGESEFASDALNIPPREKAGRRSPEAPPRRAFHSRTRLAVAAGALAAVMLLSNPLSRLLDSRSADSSPSVVSAPQANATSVAVLPFVNLSGDPGQEFFSDGMTEEVTAALARVPNLRVVARTSAFQFKGQNRDVRRVAESVGATHLLEGSVRKEGDRVRITTQLIEADEGTQIWSENYDRQLTDIFIIQEDIARAIAASLRMPLGLDTGKTLVRNRDIDLDSYEKLLRAKALYDGRAPSGNQLQNLGELQNYTRAEALVNEVIAKNPEYAPALALLGAIYFQVASIHAGDVNKPIPEARAQINELRDKGEAAARRALQADPNLTWAYATLNILVWSRGKPVEAEELYLKALALDPADYYLLDGYAIRIGAAGRTKDALALLERARAVEPFQPVILLRYAEDLWLNGRNDEAIALAKTLRSSDRATTLARIYASMGRYAEAADALTEIASDPDSAAAQAARLLRTAPSKTESPGTLPRLPTGYDYVYLHLGAPERALAGYERRAEIGYLAGNPTAYVWHASYAPVRKTEQFKSLMRKVGLVDYWRAKGWPDLCRPTTGDDFICD